MQVKAAHLIGVIGKVDEGVIFGQVFPFFRNGKED